MVGIEGEVGHEVVGYGIADEIARHLLNIGNKKVRLGFLLVIHWIVLVLDVFGAVYDSAELAFFYARDVEDDVLCLGWQWGFAAFRHLQLFFQEPFILFLSLEVENLFLVQY